MACDIEGGVRDYLRAFPAVSAIAGARSFYGVPRKGTEYPLTVVARVGGGRDATEAPIDLPIVQVDCWADTKAEAQALAQAVEEAFDAIRGATSLNADVVAYGADVESVIWLPDPSDKPKYAVTAAVTARAA